MRKIFVPKNINLDTASSSWLTCFLFGIPEEQVQFVPPQWDGSEMGDQDISLGLQVPKSTHGTVIRYGREKGTEIMKSCFTRILETAKDGLSDDAKNNMDVINQFTALGRYIDRSLTKSGPWPIQDGVSCKHCGTSPAHCSECNSIIEEQRGPFNPHLVDIGFIFESMKSFYESQEWSVEEIMSELLEEWHFIMNTMMHKHGCSARARQLSNEIPRENINGIDVAIAVGIDGISSSDIAKSLFYNGTGVVIYKNGNDIGIIRNRDLKQLDLRTVSKFIEEDGWDYYVTGVMASRGTQANPSSTPSKYEPNDILGFIKKIIVDGNIVWEPMAGKNRNRNAPLIRN